VTDRFAVHLLLRRSGGVGLRKARWARSRARVTGYLCAAPSPLASVSLAAPGGAELGEPEAPPSRAPAGEVLWKGPRRPWRGR
jgi:hypothetical protein